MSSPEAAALLLSLVTNQERADAIVGDLLESYGLRRFWFDVLQTFVAQLWRQAVTDPFTVAGLAVAGACAEVLCLLAACILSYAILLSLVSVSRVFFHYNDLPDWLFQWPPYFLYSFAAPFAMGRWMSRRLPGREAVGTLGLALAHAAINLFIGGFFWVAAGAGGEHHISVTVFARIIDLNGDFSHTLTGAAYYLTVYPALVLAGAAHKSLHAPSGPRVIR